MYLDDLFSSDEEIDALFAGGDEDDVIREYFRYLRNAERKISKERGEWVGFFSDGTNNHLVGPESEEQVRQRLANAPSASVIYKLGCAEDFFEFYE